MNFQAKCILEITSFEMNVLILYYTSDRRASKPYKPRVANLSRDEENITFLVATAGLETICLNMCQDLDPRTGF